MSAPAAPRISILIDNFNYQGFLPQSIESALGQVYPQVEVVVVDDASTDGSRAVIERYGERVVPVVLPVNGGQAAAFNAGVRACHGDVVMLLDADDFLYPEAAERVAAAWRPGLSQVHYRLHLADATGALLGTHPRRELALDAGDLVPRLLATGGYQSTVTSGNAFSRAVLERILPIPVETFRISADGYLVTAAPFHGQVAAIEEPLGVYRLHGANAWASGADDGGGGLEALGARLRRGLQHDEERHLALRAAASAAGRSPAPGFEIADAQRLENRLASLLVAPAQHPFPGDSVLGLAWRGARAACGLRGSRRLRAVMTCWFLSMGLLPRILAADLAAWRLQPASRPDWLNRLLKGVRRWLFAPFTD